MIINAFGLLAVRLALPLLLFLSTLLLTSCTKQGDRWTFHQIKGDEKEFDSSKFCYLAPRRAHGIDLELLKLKTRLRIALVVHSEPIPAHEEDPHKALVRLTIDGKKHLIVAERHEGGQRVILPESAHAPLLSCLKSKKPFKVEASGYAETIQCHRFRL